VVSDNFGADKWISQVTPLIKGKCGGKGLAAQATGSNTDALDEALQTALDFAKLNLSWGTNVEM